MEAIKDNLTMVIILVAIALAGYYVYSLNATISDLKKAKAKEIVEEIEKLTNERERLVEKLNELEKSSTQQTAERERLERELVIYKQRSNEYYEKWEALRVDTNDSSVVALLTILRNIANQSEPSPVNP